MRKIDTYIRESLYGYEHTAIEAYKFMNDIHDIVKEHGISNDETSMPYYTDVRIRMTKKDLPSHAPITRSRTITVVWVNPDKNKSVLEIGQVLNNGYNKTIIIKYTCKDQLCSVSGDIESQWDLPDNWSAYRCTESVKDALKKLIESIETE